jgi:putative membrane protein
MRRVITAQRSSPSRECFSSPAFSFGLSAFGGDVAAAGKRSAAGVVGLLLTAMHMTLLGALLALSSRPLYSHAQGLTALRALDDQHLGGAIMLLIGGVSYLVGGLWLIVRLLHYPLFRPAERL